MTQTTYEPFDTHWRRELIDGVFTRIVDMRGNTVEFAAGGVQLTAIEKAIGATSFQPNRGPRHVNLNSLQGLKGDGTESVASAIQTLVNLGMAVEFEGDFIFDSTVVLPNGGYLKGVARWRDGAAGVLGNNLRPGAGLTAGYMIDVRGQFTLGDFSLMGDRRKGVWGLGTQQAVGIGKPVWDNLRVDGFDINFFFDSACEFPIGGLFKNTYSRNWGQAGAIFGGKGTTPRSGEDGLTFLNFHATNLGVADLYNWTPVVTANSPDTTHDVVDWTADVAAQGGPAPYWGYQVVRAATTAGPWVVPPDWVDSNFTQTSYTAEKVAGETWVYRVIANNPACSIARNKKVFFDTCHAEYGTIGLLLVNVRDCWIGHMYGETRNGDPASSSPNTRGGFCVLYSNGSFATIGGRIYCESYAYGSFCGYNGHVSLDSYDVGAGVKYGMNGNFGGAQQSLIIRNQVGYDGTTIFNVSPRGNVNEMRHEVHYSLATGERFHEYSTDSEEHEVTWFRRDAKRNTGVKFLDRSTTTDGHFIDMTGRLRVRPYRKTALAFPFTNLSAGGGFNPRTDPPIGVTTTFFSLTLPTGTHNCGFTLEGYLDIADSGGNARMGVAFTCKGTMLKNAGMANTSVTLKTDFGTINNPNTGTANADPAVTITAVGAGAVANFQVNWSATIAAPSGAASARLHCNLLTHQGAGEVQAAAYG